jgi:hypothetical protein
MRSSTHSRMERWWTSTMQANSLTAVDAAQRREVVSKESGNIRLLV